MAQEASVSVSVHCKMHLRQCTVAETAFAGVRFALLCFSLGRWRVLT